MARLTNADILNGSKLIVFIDGNAVAFGTADSINITPNTIDIATKSHGLYPSLFVNSIGWEVQCDNLASLDGIKTLNKILNDSKDQTTVHLKFGQPVNWGPQGIVGAQGIADSWTTTTDILAEGDAMITNYSINMPAQENGTISVTFTGVGALTLAEPAS